MKRPKKSQEFKGNPYTSVIRIKPDKKEWLEQNRNKLKKQSPTAFLDEILEDYIKPNLFKKPRR